jgi:DNA-binding transcriptional regulator YiaG
MMTTKARPTKTSKKRVAVTSANSVGAPEKKKLPTGLKESLDALPQNRKTRVTARANELIAEEKALRELRAARAMSQVELARRLGVKQAEISKMERRTDMYLSTLREYVEGLGGSLSVIADFPGIGSTKIKHLGSKWIGEVKPERDR